MRKTELGPVVRGLLEVVGEELVLAVVCAEPPGELFVQPSAHALRHLAVGRVADQRVTEAEAVLARERGLTGPHELLAHEREQHGRDARPLVDG